MMRTYLTFLAATALMAGSANAAIVSGALTGGSAFNNGGTFLLVANPTGLSVGNNNFNDNNVRGFNEKQKVTLGSALQTDTGTIASGTLVSSQFLNFDPNNGRSGRGNVVFNTPVLGIIWSRSLLIASNFLGASGVTYLTPSQVGFEDNDSASFSASTVSFNLNASSPGDSWRVITAGVPEPSSWAMLIAGFGLVGAGMRRRRVAVA